MRQYQKMKKLTISAILMCFGIILPYFSSHMMGIPGTVFLPMHLPILLAGFLVGPLYGGMVGIITPILSSLFTGMPNFFPMLPIMIVELSCYGYFSGLFYQKCKLPIYISLPLTMVIGRIGYGLSFFFLFCLYGSLKALTVWSAIVTGLPGIVIQMIFIPLLLGIVQKKEEGENYKMQTNTSEDKIPLEFIEKIKTKEATLIIIQDEILVHQSNQRGIRCILEMYLSQKEILNQSIVVDKIIGKAAAMVMIAGGVSYVYGETMSILAKEILEEHHIKFQYAKLVDLIENRTHTGLCPIESAVININNVEEGIDAIQNKLNSLKMEEDKK